MDGLVDEPLTLDYEALTAMPGATRRLVLECAANGRRFYDPPVPGVAWGRGAVAQARWTGVSLEALLTQGRIRAGATHVVFHSLEQPDDGGRAFVRSLPIDDVAARGVLLAWNMNGETLTPAHGFPLRVVVPGWTGQHWVKWLTRIEARDAAPAAPSMQDEFRMQDGAMIRGGGPKSIISSPADGARVRDRIVRPSGIAWAGEAEIASVAVSADGGRTWHEAQLAAYGGNGAWRRWEAEVTLPDDIAGEVAVVALATDDRGRTQPERPEWNPGGYLWNGWDRVTVHS